MAKASANTTDLATLLEATLAGIKKRRGLKAMIRPWLMFGRPFYLRLKLSN